MAMPSSLRKVKRRLRRAQRSGQLLVRSLLHEHRLFLTFDDGPSAHTQPILDYLAQYDAKATFFLIGENVTDESIPLMAEALRQGHAIGSHTWSHADLSTCSPEQIAHEIRSADYALTRIYEEAGRNPAAEPRLFRFPFLKQGQRKQRQAAHAVLKQLGYEVHHCDIDPTDWKVPLGEQTLDEAVELAMQARAGDVVLLHETEFAIPLLERILPTLAERYDLCSLEEGDGYSQEDEAPVAA
jgi:peptidoglycan/xylan/chitin deacetylase (PgdA/CDA1 family)